MIKIIFYFAIFLIFTKNMYPQIQNPDFELSNNSSLGWEVYGNTINPIVPFNIFTTERVRDTSAIVNTIGGDYWRGISHPIGNHGNHLISTYEFLNDLKDPQERLGESSKVIIESAPFVIADSLLYFLIGGTGGAIELKIKGINSDSFYTVKTQIPELKNKEILTRKYFDMSQYLNDTAKIIIIDTSLTSHINADDFFFSDSILSIQTYSFRTSYDDSIPAEDNDTIYDRLNYLLVRDNDTLLSHFPLWGFVDTHAHWMNHATFAPGILYGRPYGDIRVSLSGCKDAHAKNIGNKIKYFFYERENNHWKNLYTGYPGFQDWPNFTSKFHQSMYIDWVKRAFFGGLRVMVCVLSNSESLSHALSEERDDVTATRLGIDSLNSMIKTLHDNGEKWLEIAKNPEDLKRIILENKLAIITGIEVDKLGGWADKSQCNEDSVIKYLEQLKNAGVSYLFPVHISNNAFGGFAVYGSEHFAVNNFYTRKDLENDRYVNVEGSDSVSFRLGQEYIKTPEILFASIDLCYSPPGMNACGESYYTHLALHKGHVNTLGLTPLGKFAIKEMMKRAMIIDIDHMSFNSNNSTLEIALKNNYPLIAGHTNFLEQEFDSKYAGFDSPVSMNKLRNEHAKTDYTLSILKQLGGMVSPITEGGKEIHDYKGLSYGKLEISNDNPGSSKTWAQSYLYAIEKMDRKGVGFGTDMNGYLTEIAPRFGTFSAFSLFGDEKRINQLGGVLCRRKMALNQQNGVAYTNELKDCGEHKFRGNGVFSHNEAKILRSIFEAHKNDKRATDASLVNARDSLYKLDSIYDFVRGFREGINSKGDINIFDTNSVDYKAAFTVGKHYSDSTEITKTNYNDDYFGLLKSKIDTLDICYKTWLNIHGNNIPMKRCIIYSNKDTIIDNDFNIDGLAHYGLIPDFIQDLKNIGLNYELLTPLFNSAADFTAMWKKCEIRSLELTGKTK